MLAVWMLKKMFCIVGYHSPFFLHDFISLLLIVVIPFERIADGTRATVCGWCFNLSTFIWNDTGNCFKHTDNSLFQKSLMIKWSEWVLVMFLGPYKLDWAEEKYIREAWISASCLLVSLLVLCFYKSWVLKLFISRSFQNGILLQKLQNSCQFVG